MKHGRAPSKSVLLIAGMGIHAAAIGVLIAANTAVAGPINPPSGPVAGTSKPLSEIEPRIAINNTNTPGDADSVYHIGQAGSYYLTAHVLATTGKSGIEIGASGVTIDLNGFQIGSSGGLAGIDASSTTIERIVIRNGRIIGCAGGIILTLIPNVVIEGVSVEDSTGYGIRVGSEALIKDCAVLNNTSYGLLTSSRSNISGCRASSNGNTGISVSDYCTITHCSSNNNSTVGIASSSGCTITECTASGNTGNGITATETASISKCVSNFNGSSGIFALWNSTVSDCVTFANEVDGIRVELASLVKGNSCIDNGNDTAGAGIHATGDENRIEGNNCIRNTRGIHVSSSGNFIAGNTCGNSLIVNWEIVANNKCLVVVAANSIAISGDAGGTSPGSTSPWTNFTVE